MKLRYESEDGKVSGYGDEGKASVTAYEADPLARFSFPWSASAQSSFELIRADRSLPSGHDYRLTALLGSRLAPLVRELVKSCTDEYGDDWRAAFSSTPSTHRIQALEDALNETLNV